MGKCAWLHCAILVLDTVFELNVQQVIYGSYANSLNLLIMNSLMTHIDLKQKDLASKLVCLNVDGLTPSKALDQK
jgi:hypothetical protein